MVHRAKGFVGETRLIVQGISDDTLVTGARAIVSASTAAPSGLVNTSDVQRQCEERCSDDGSTDRSRGNATDQYRSCRYSYCPRSGGIVAEKTNEVGAWR
jgi:hypothetical protein